MEAGILGRSKFGCGHAGNLLAMLPNYLICNVEKKSFILNPGLNFSVTKHTARVK